MTKRAEGLQQAVAYLQLYISKYPYDVLKQQLRQNGYPDGIIEEATRQVFSGGTQQQAPYSSSASELLTGQAEGGGGFFDIRRKRAYTSGGLKFLDFAVGLFGLLLIFRILGGIIEFVSDIFGFRLYGLGIFGLLFVFGGLYLALPIAGIVYFWKRRRFLARGMLWGLILFPFVFIFMGGFYFLNYFF